jgi:hypothetical protein
MTRRLVSRDESADRRPHEIVDPPLDPLADLAGQRLAQSLGHVGMHEDARLLQEDRAAQARGQDEMALEHCTRPAEYVDHFVGRHRLPFPR